jgi:hypothetical protein
MDVIAFLESLAKKLAKRKKKGPSSADYVPYPDETN